MVSKENPTTDKLTLQIQLKNNPQLPYIAVELFQISKTSAGFALSCYPLDYLGVANQQPQESMLLIETTPVFNMILSADALERLIKELSLFTSDSKE